jgi:hypothetical protein
MALGLVAVVAWAAVGFVTLSLTSGDVAQASGGWSTGGTTVPIRAYADSGSFVPSDVDCSRWPAPTGTVSTLKASGTTVIGTHDGDTLVGSETWDACFYNQADNSVEAFGETQFTGTLQGCGGGQPGTIKIGFHNKISAPDSSGARAAVGLKTLEAPGTGGFAAVEWGSFATYTTIRDFAFTDGLGVGLASC